MTDLNTRRLHDRINLLEGQVSTQSQIIDSYRRKNTRLQRENTAYAAQVGRIGLQATQQAKNGGRG